MYELQCYKIRVFKLVHAKYVKESCNTQLQTSTTRFLKLQWAFPLMDPLVTFSMLNTFQVGSTLTW